MLNQDELKKNDIIKIEIVDMGSEGEGIGHVNGYALFVKDTIPGDVAEIKIMKMKKSYGYARLMNLIHPSAFRTEPKCPIARQCGGCQIQHMDYKEQLRYKENKVKNCLTRIGKFDQDYVESIMEPVIGMEDPFYYRNKAQFPVGRDKEGNVVIGFYAGRTHSIMDTTHCYIQAEANEEIIKRVKAFIEKYNITTYNEENHTGLVRHILTRVGFTTGEIMVCLIINGDDLPHRKEFIEDLIGIRGMTSISINVNKGKTNVILGDKVKTLWGQPYITDYIGDVKYQISPLSFYQVNPVQTKILYETALDYAGLQGNEVVWDLYCGIGTISLFLARRAKKVYGVEIIPEAIEDARTNAKINGIHNAEFFVGAAEDVLPKKYKEDHIHGDVVVVDPPRKGCDESLLNTIIKMSPKRIVYVSCDTGTLARDLRYLSENGYELKRVRPVDQFGHSTHMECVCLLERGKSIEK